MRLLINGQSMEVSSEMRTIADLLLHFGLEGKFAIVERNLEIVPKEEYSVTKLSDHDRLEIVHFVGGG